MNAPRTFTGSEPSEAPPLDSRANPASANPHVAAGDLQARLYEELRQFTYVLSHDLREPLRMMTAYSELLNRRYQSQLDADGREFLKYIKDAALRTDQLLSDLLSYLQQLQTRPQPPSTVDSEAALQGVLLNLDKEIRAGEAEITHEPLPKISFDFTLLSQVFRQLIANSIKFRGPESPRIHISAAETDEGFVFAVRDNGLGIDPRYHEQIFAAFRRLNGREYPGTGVGLHICKRIIEQAGGKIWVESQAGHGSVFHFTLPG